MKDWHTLNFPFKLSEYRKKFLTKTQEVLGLDYESLTCTSTAWSGELPFISDGRVDGVAVWVDYDLTPDIYLSQLTADGSDFKPYVKSIVKFLDKPLHLTNSRSGRNDCCCVLKVTTGFKFGDSDVDLQLNILSKLATQSPLM